MLQILAGKSELDEQLAGKSTLNRLEAGGWPNRYSKIICRPEMIDELLVDIFLESCEEAPVEIVLDLDTTDLELHGGQEGRFFHGYYDEYCYLPRYIFCGQHLLCVRLRQADIDASTGSLAEVKRIITQIRAPWPDTRVILRGDSGFCRDELMTWCEQQNNVHYVFGMARNERLRRIIGPALVEAGRLLSPDAAPGACIYRIRAHHDKRVVVARDAWWPKPSTLRANRTRVMW